MRAFWSQWGGCAKRYPLSHDFKMHAPVSHSGLKWCTMFSWWHIFPDSILYLLQDIWAKQQIKNSTYHTWVTALPIFALCSQAFVKHYTSLCFGQYCCQKVFKAITLWWTSRPSGKEVPSILNVAVMWSVN